MEKELNVRARAPVFAKPMEIVRPTFPPIARILEEFTVSLASGQVTNNGPWVVEFERQLENYVGVPTLVFSSGQAALMAMIKAAGVETGEVIVPSFTFAATPHAVMWCGATPVFADIKDDLSFTLDADDVERCITDKTVAILGVDPYGIACDYEALQNIATRRGLKLLIDSAPSFGTRLAGRRIGAFGDAQIFSFHATKAFNTMEGGCLCSNNMDLIERARSIRNFGQRGDGDCAVAGFNGKMMEIVALLGLEQLKTFDKANATRLNSAKRISEGLAPIPGICVAKAPTDQEPIWLYLPVLVDDRAFGHSRDEVFHLLARENLHVRKYYSPACHLMSAYTLKGKQASLPLSESAARNVLAVPIYNDMTAEECDGIVEAFRRAAPTCSRADL